ncbi:MAG: hypothetical protein FJW26_10185 [Acidimicrobiia bacterium]|nr:hypothetical protein [Acidimicrobiia bacterium]
MFLRNCLLAVAFMARLGLGLAVEHLPAPEKANLVVKGLLVCLDGSFKETDCLATPEALGLKADQGRIYPLKKQGTVDALFAEKRLQTREFRLTLRKDQSPWYELVRAQLIRGGKLFDFHYFCEVCNITTYAPGLCMCCRQESEYRESPAE